MSAAKFMTVVAAAALIAGCEAKIGKEADASNASETASAKTEDGTFSIKAPGFDMKVDIPEGLANRARVDSDSDIVYPGAKMSGIHIDAANGEKSDGVDLSFTSEDAPAKVLAWYRSADRQPNFTVASVTQEAGGYLLTGSQKDDGDPFRLQLKQTDGGGTHAQLSLQDQH